MMKWLIMPMVLAVLPMVAVAESADEASAPVTGVALNKSSPSRKGRLKAAIFVQNHAGEVLDESVPMFRDLLTSRLTEKGFAIMDGHDVAERFQETEGSADPVVDVLRAVSKGIETAKTETSVESVLNGASALRIAQMLDADYLIVATFASVGSERKTFHGEGTLYKTSNEVFTRTLRTSLKVLEGNQGTTVYGDTVVTKARLAGNSHITTVTDDGDNTLIDEAAAEIAENISSKIQRIKKTVVEGESTMMVEVKANVEGATLEVDGATLGSIPGAFAIRPGLHQVAVSKERFVTWRRTINVVPNQVLNVTLERSAVGDDRNENSLRVAREDELIRKTQNANIDIAKEQSSADAYAKRQIADGEKEYRKNSHTQIEGPVNELNIGRSADALVKIERE
jgi:hypothetical protein